MRLFTALALPAPIVNALIPFLDGQPPGNLHVTLAFLGEQPETRLDDIRQALARMPRRAPISISVAGLGYFPNHETPRVLWAGVQPIASLRELMEAIQAELIGAGVTLEPDPYSYTPHVTLAHPNGQPLPADPYPEDFGSFTAERFHLYESQAAAAGTTTYRELASYPISGNDL